MNREEHVPPCLCPELGKRGVEGGDVDSQLISRDDDRYVSKLRVRPAVTEIMCDVINP